MERKRRFENILARVEICAVPVSTRSRAEPWGLGRHLCRRIVFARSAECAPMMAKDLKDKTKIDEITLTIVEKKEPREWKSGWSGAGGRVCDATGEDGDGEKVSLSLWNDDADKVQVNDRIKITNGWVSSYKGKLQVSAGKFGKLEVL